MADDNHKRPISDPSLVLSRLTAARIDRAVDELMAACAANGIEPSEALYASYFALSWSFVRIIARMTRDESNAAEVAGAYAKLWGEQLPEDMKSFFDVARIAAGKMH